MPIYLAGPTAVGKTELSLILAEKLGGEIISVDSMQVYRGMDIGTAKISDLERERVSHHLIDILSITEQFSAADFLQHARLAEQSIVARGRIPIYCGGTGLYFSALGYGLGEAPPSDSALREELQNTASETLLEELRNKDPQCYETIDRQNLRRVIRAIEVIRLTGKPFSAQKATWQQKPLAGTWIGLERPRAILYDRINQRVDQMFQDGLVEETKKMIEAGLLQNPVALQSLGYRQVVDYLNGKTDLESTIDQVKQKTRQFAKRQLTWFKRQLPLHWVDLEEGNVADCLSKVVHLATN